MAKVIFYRVGQTARELGVSSYRIRRLAESGLIPDAEYSGSQWHIPVAVVEKLKRDGIPALPKTIDVDQEGASPAANQKERAPTTLLAEPSAQLIASAERAEMSGRELTAAKNNLELKRLRREEVEIDDFHRERERRLQKEEDEQLRRDEEQFEADIRDREKAAAVTRRKEFISAWLEYALEQIPHGVPREVQLDVHQAVIDTLAKVDASERDYTVRRLVDGAVERGLRTWNMEKAKQAALEDAISHLPYDMQWDESWKGRATKTATQALADVRAGTSRDELDTLARSALEPLTDQFEHAKKVKTAIDNIHITGATQDELADARELALEGLSAVSSGSTDRQITQACDRAIKNVVDRVAGRLAREELQRRRQDILDSVRRELPYGISKADQEAAIAEVGEALAELPAGSSEEDMAAARDEIVGEYRSEYDTKAIAAARKAERARKKEQLIAAGLQAIYPQAEKMLRRYDYDRTETAFDIKMRVTEEVEQALRQELDGSESEQYVRNMVQDLMLELEGCD